jgi:hypothetical protein
VWNKSPFPNSLKKLVNIFHAYAKFTWDRPLRNTSPDRYCRMNSQSQQGEDWALTGPDRVPSRLLFGQRKLVLIWCCGGMSWKQTLQDA